MNNYINALAEFHLPHGLGREQMLTVAKIVISQLARLSPALFIHEAFEIIA